jgi:hypothetical protein
MATYEYFLLWVLGHHFVKMLSTADFSKLSHEIDFTFKVWEVNFRLNFPQVTWRLTVLKTIMFSATQSGITHDFLKRCIP